MTSRPALITVLLTATLLGQTAAQQQSVLSGRTNGVAWTLYGPGPLPNLSAQSSQLRLSAPPQATVLGAKYQQDAQNALLVYRQNAPLRTTFDFHDQQLRAQGFTRSNMNLTGNDARASYTRNGSSLQLTLTHSDTTHNVYRAQLELSELTSLNATNTSRDASAAPGNALLSDEGNTDRLGYLVFGPVALDNLQRDEKVIRLSVPQGATLVDAQKEDEDIRLSFRSTQTLAQITEFYSRQFQAQGFERMPSTAANEPQKTGATFSRTNTRNRIEWTAEREENGTYQLLFNFEGARDGNTVSGQERGVPFANTTPSQNTEAAPLYSHEMNGLRYDLYGPDFRMDTLTRDEQRVRLAVPPSATNIDRPALIDNDVTLEFASPQPLREVFDHYDRQFRQQGFSQVSGQLTESATEIIARYARGDRTVRFTVERETGTPARYVVTLDFTP
ncbi:hypothetical protein [Deinococcus peraridilitoris]|uniref:Uncharacterized protein n=1 Tax=Deinococcus peraridilitoris (strain DSM 19664 / LMG 22246 / CIP 109416 / KR-200) TaxID=937777 RepID=L0A909_DEIPD|nr:hypothetical protein [Deinococcus peraridilitoris]AFZ69550.1 hypothetical protein Deipe_4186 [Deinococcus peraridilitoris DSM 19664]